MPPFDPYRHGRETVGLVETAGESTGVMGIQNTADQEIDPLTEQTGADIADSLASSNDVHTDTLASTGTFDAQAVPSGTQVMYLADPGNDAPVTVNGDFPIPAGMAVRLRVDDVSKPEFTVSGTDSVHVITEIDT